MAKNGSIQNVSYNIICGKHLIAHQGGESGEGGGRPQQAQTPQNQMCAQKSWKIWIQAALKIAHPFYSFLAWRKRAAVH